MSQTRLDSGVQAWRGETLCRLLLRASQAERSQTLARLRRRGYADVTHTDTALLANVDPHATTISAVARRCGVTRQAASQQLALLERKGYVSREPDPGDSRAVLVARTGKGQALLGDVLDVAAGFEADYAEQVGAARVAELKALLAGLLRYADPGGADSAD